MRFPASPRTLIVSLSYPAHDGDPSGHFVRHQALELARCGEDVHVVAPRPSPGDAALYRSTPIAGDALFAWPGAIARARENPLRLLALAPMSIALRRATTGERIDRVHLHWLVPTAWPLAPRFEGAHVEAIAHGADVRMLLAVPSVARERALAALLDRTTRVRFVADALRERLARALGPRARAALEARSYVEPMGIDIADVQAPRDAPPSYVVWVGRDIPSKRLDLAIDACSRANRWLVVVGATRAPRADVTFVGTVPRAEALGWIAGADLLLSTSSEEGAPTAIREARAQGVRVVACPAGDITRWANEDPGILIAEEEPARISAMLERSGRVGVTRGAPVARANLVPSPAHDSLS